MSAYARHLGDDRWWMRLGPTKRAMRGPCAGKARRASKRGRRIPATYAAYLGAVVGHDHGARGFNLVLHTEGTSWCVAGERDDGERGRELFYGWPQAPQYRGDHWRFETYTVHTWCERCDLPTGDSDDSGGPCCPGHDEEDTFDQDAVARDLARLDGGS